MSRSRMRILIIIGGAIGLLVLLALTVTMLVGVNRYRHPLELAATDALGMDVRIGRLGIGFFPGLHVTASDGRIVDEQGMPVASAKRIRLWIGLLPLLRKKFRLHRIELTQPRLFIERDPEGRLNAERLKKAMALLGALDGASVSLSEGTLLYVDRRSEKRFEVTDFDLDVSRMRLPAGTNPQAMKGLSLEARLACGEVRTKDLSVSALTALVRGKEGVFELEPVTMHVFGGQAAVRVRADVSGAVPIYQVRYSLPSFRIEEFLKMLSPKRAVEGAMNFSMTLSLQGTTGSQLIQSAAGTVSLRGEHLTLVGTDLDRVLSRFESSQSFNLVDVGAVFLAGPLGLVVTKGYNFASLFEGTGGNCTIETLVSDWKVERGVAQAKDVAMATTHNRIAVQGGLDFVNERFADVTVAAVDAAGCARVRQALRGSFAKPTVEKPHVLTSLSGPVLKLYRQTRGLFPAAPCEAFYSGSVAPPR